MSTRDAKRGVGYVGLEFNRQDSADKRFRSHEHRLKFKLFSEKDKIPVFKEQATQAKKEQPERWEGIRRCAVSWEQERTRLKKARMDCSGKDGELESEGLKRYL